MSSALQRQVTVPFSPGSRSISLEIKNDPGMYADGLAHLLLIPDVPASLAADVGEVVLGGSKVIEIPGGILTFSGSDSAPLPATPIDTPPEFKSLFAFNSKGQPTTADAHYDRSTGAVRLTRSCTGAISYTGYKSSARIITYRPRTEVLPTYTGGGVIGGGKTTYGVIAAYYEGTLITHQVVMPDMVNGNDEVELYRIVSDKVITPEGEFEKPPAYPNNTYPGLGISIDMSSSVLIERVHEIGFMDSTGRAWTKEPYAPILEPYVGSLSYKPVKRLRESPVPEDRYDKKIVARARDIVKARGRQKL